LLPLLYVGPCMTTYNFRREAKLHVVYNNSRTILDVYPDLSFSQTFAETAVKVKTLHSQYNMFDAASITKANPANFNFTIPLLRESDMKVIYDLLLDYNTVEASVKSADFYIETNSEIYKLEKSVIESGIFQIARDKVVILNCSGTASKLVEASSIPANLQTRSASRTFVVPNFLDIQVGGTSLGSVTGVSLEVRNAVQWLEPSTLHKSIGILEASGTTYHEDFVVSGRQVSGNVQQYVTNENANNANTWRNGASISVKVGNKANEWSLNINLPETVYTNRLDLQELLAQSYDFRMTYNPTSLSDLIKIGA
jgi:hypothetical protein